MGRLQRWVRRRPALVALAALAVLLVGLALALSRRRTKETFDVPADSVFVSIASYRDTDCLKTIKDLFAKAAKPERVYVGICEQNTASADEVCLPARFKWHDHVRRVSIPHGEARGPTYARYLCSTLYRGETYFCQTDSHMRFVQGWEQLAIDATKACPDPSRAVLSHYPHDFKDISNDDVPVLCGSKFDGNGMITFDAVTLPKSAAPRPVPFTAGGFLFGPGTMLRDVPFDPDLPHLFQGEEILYSARLWTAGYDFYTPPTNVVFHHYYRKDSPKFWNDVDYSAVQKETIAKVKRLLAGEMPDYAHGMGDVRTLDEYWAFAGIDWKGAKTTSSAKFCKAL